MRRPYPMMPDRLRPDAWKRAPSAQVGAQIGRRVSLVALQEEIQLPGDRGLVVMRRLKVLRIEQAAAQSASLTPPRRPLRAPTLAPKQIEAAAHRAPPPQPEPPELECRLDGRLVRLRSVGEMMTDEAGSFYEMHGGQLRPLGELVRDEHGRIFEVHRKSESVTADSTKENPNVSPTDHREVCSNTEDDNCASVPAQPRGAQAGPEKSSRGYRKIIADPGLYLKVPWARVKCEIAQHVKHSEKLRDADEIECYVQIYEAQRTLAAAELAAAELHDGALQSQLQPLTRDKAHMLGVPQLFKPTRYPFETRASSRQIHAGQRVYRLWPLFDPTAERLAEPGRESEASSKNDVALRIDVPLEYSNDALFRHSREEVVYDMKRLGTLPPEARSVARRLSIHSLRVVKALVTAMISRRRMKKWRAMLAGKEPDQQLWAVTPPRGFSYNAAVRRWAEHTLRNAGYDSLRMLLEWEIFWRRRGWN